MVSLHKNGNIFNGGSYLKRVCVILLRSKPIAHERNLSITLVIRDNTYVAYVVYCKFVIEKRKEEKTKTIK